MQSNYQVDLFHPDLANRNAKLKKYKQQKVAVHAQTFAPKLHSLAAQQWIQSELAEVTSTRRSRLQQVVVTASIEFRFHFFLLSNNTLRTSPLHDTNSLFFAAQVQVDWKPDNFTRCVVTYLQRCAIGKNKSGRILPCIHFTIAPCYWCTPTVRADTRTPKPTCRGARLLQQCRTQHLELQLPVAELMISNDIRLTFAVPQPAVAMRQMLPLNA